VREISQREQGEPLCAFVFSALRLAYEVEFVAEDGSTVTEFGVEPDAIRGLSTNRAKHQAHRLC
jgi:hypothetical protein